jgi:hypothetical protein
MSGSGRAETRGALALGRPESGGPEARGRRRDGLNATASRWHSEDRARSFAATSWNDQRARSPDSVCRRAPIGVHRHGRLKCPAPRIGAAMSHTLTRAWPPAPGTSAF